MGIIYSKTEADALFAKSTDLQKYAKITDLDTYAQKTDLDTYAQKSLLSNYAKMSDISGLTWSSINVSMQSTLLSVGSLASSVNARLDSGLARLDSGLARVDSGLVCSGANCKIGNAVNTVMVNAIGGLASGPFMLEYYTHQPKVCLDAGKPSTVPYAIACDSNNVNQHFYLDTRGRLINVGTGKCLDTNGVNKTWTFNPCNDHQNQQFLRSRLNGAFTIPDTGCLDIGNASAYAPCASKNENQIFRFKQLSNGVES